MTNLPDIKLACVTLLAASSVLPQDVTVAGATADELPVSLPYVALFEVPGPGAVFPRRLARSAINVQTWGFSAQATRNTAHTVYDILHDAEGHTVSDVYFFSVGDITGPGEDPDPEYPDLFRWVFTVEIRARNS